ncbi:xanthine dehydrogenase family protein molybdopterin-binding subunit [Ciceribacter sp. L1K22]|uniref:xanthine dehydrogenase family protein molybdopterin-binding subunit n=1 Tax=Ciceribacter sp. L1K22 TaxID=2820275 RepID=UPI001ABDBFD0|nr:xanthine dehydrogenase family protein molybdopterin-binding subunit [Ciceribacter sp. L1K22]MBO3761120.1 xanthine dehydrogenase family protein molybdopterin-binding subunit [Ciceribacter sp. L1K22]
MTRHMKMDVPDTRRRLDDMAQGALGLPLDRPEGPLKVSGAAPYAGEWQDPDLCHGVLVRAPATKGRVTGIEAAAVEAMPGILAVISDKRMLRNPAQGMANEAPVQGPEEIAYFGQPVALVVAETFEQARHGAQALTLTIERAADAVVDPEAVEPEVPEKKQSSMGDLDAAMRDATHSIDVTYTTPPHSSAPMEPHASIAQWHGDRLTLRGSYQMLKYNRNELADSLGIAPEKVRILSPYVGGGFGSKLGIAPEAVAAAIAAQKLGRPVSVTMTRPQVFEATMRRSETRQRVRLAADAEGRLTGIGHETLVSSLFDESFSEPVTQATPFMYRGENRVIGHRIARLNRTCAGSVRAPGEAVGVTVFENAMDELAHKAGIDPVELRLRNIPDEDPSKHIPFSSHKLAEALSEGARAFCWNRRKATPGQVRDGEWLVGMGMASAFRVNMLQEAEARVRLNPDGTAEVETDQTDIGTGTYAVLTQIACEMLGLQPKQVTVRLGDTDLPPGSGSGGSFGAASSGTAVFLACEEIREKLATAAGCAEADLTLKDGMAISGNRQRPIVELLAGLPLEARGHIEPGDIASKARQATYGAYFAEVAVNSVTGETRVRRMTGAFAAGRILNAKTARSQCLGGMIWGIGMALTEELAHDPRDGHIVNHDLAEYHIPVNADVPQIEVILLSERDDHANPLQAKGLGELGICGAAAAVTNAIFNATGVRVRAYPATLEKVMAGM